MESAELSTGSSKSFGHYWLILKRRWLPASATFVTLFVLALLATSLKKPTYVAEGTLKFERTSPTSSLTGVGKEISNLEPLVEKNSPLPTEAEVIRSVPVTNGVIQQLNLRDKEGHPINREDFLKSLKVAEIRGTDILKVAYTDGDPNKAAEVVNVLMNVYIQNNILAHRAQATAARKFVEAQLPKAEAAVSEAEEALRQFKERNNVVALKEEATAAVSVLTDLQRQIATAESQLADMSAQANLFQTRLGVAPQQAVSVVALSQAPGVQEALKELQQAESQLAILRSRFQEANPKVISLKERVARLKQLLRERTGQVMGDRTAVVAGNVQAGELQQDLTKELVILEGKRQGLVKQLSALSQAQIAYQQRAKGLPRLEQQQRELERHLEATQTTYSQLLQRSGEIRVAENQNVGNVRVVSLAQAPDKPNSSKAISYLAAILLALLGSAAVVYVLETRDKSIKTVDQAKQLFGYTLLGVVPFYGKSRKMLSDGTSPELWPNSPGLEGSAASPVNAAYRILQANLKFLSSDKPLKVITISSSVPKEGKSTVSANLALAMAQVGKRVLLVDADMQCPNQHRIWDLSNEVGLSHMLAEQVGPEKAIKSVADHLDVLSAGVIPPNSIALLDSQRMASLIERFSADYDTVILDTPPLTLATDALILGKMTDGILIVVRPGAVDVGSASFAKGLMAQSNQTVLGQVVNGVVAGNDPHSHYYFVSDHYSQESTIGANVLKL